MKIIGRLFQRLPQPRAAWATAISVLLLAALLWLSGTPWDYAQSRIGRSWPEWAWQHGTPDMQRSAAYTLKDRIVGMDIDAVVSLLGPGADGWPQRYRQDFGRDGIVGFNVRSWYNNGLDVYFEGGKVVSVSYYD